MTLIRRKKRHYSRAVSKTWTVWKSETMLTTWMMTIVTRISLKRSIRNQLRSRKIQGRQAIRTKKVLKKKNRRPKKHLRRKRRKLNLKKRKKNPQTLSQSLALQRVTKLMNLLTLLREETHLIPSNLLTSSDQIISFS